MRIATWNVNGLRARLDFVKLWLEERQPDVVGLQELKMTNEQFPADEFEALGYAALVHGQKSWNGVAILSKEPAEVLQEGLPGQADFGARLLRARVGGLDFTTIYAPNGKTLEHEDYPRKLGWYESLRTWVDASFKPEDAHVLCGDFNICPTALDSHGGEGFDGEIFHTDAERERLAAVADWGLVDLWRDKHPDEPAYSWWDYRGGAFHRKQGLRIDFVLGTRAVADRVREASIDRDFRKKKDGLTASDHAPVIVDLD